MGPGLAARLRPASLPGLAPRLCRLAVGIPALGRLPLQSTPRRDLLLGGLAAGPTDREPGGRPGLGATVRRYSLFQLHDAQPVPRCCRTALLGARYLVILPRS